MRLATLAALVILTACATPYRRLATPSDAAAEGYRDRSIGPGTYELEVRVNCVTDLREYAERRAYELCPTGYETLVRNVAYRPACANVQLTIHCQAARPEPGW